MSKIKPISIEEPRMSDDRYQVQSKGSDQGSDYYAKVLIETSDDGVEQ